MSQINPATRYIPLNNNAGAFTTIRCSITCGYMEIEEDAAEDGGGAGQGLQGNLLDPFTGQPIPAPPVGYEVWLPSVAGADVKGDYPIVIGDARRNHGKTYTPIGNGGSGTYTDTRSPVPQVLTAGPGHQAPALGTPIIQLRSATANATGVRVREWA